MNRPRPACRRLPEGSHLSHGSPRARTRSTPDWNRRLADGAPGEPLSLLGPGAASAVPPLLPWKRNDPGRSVWLPHRRTLPSR